MTSALLPTFVGIEDHKASVSVLSTTPRSSPVKRNERRSQDSYLTAQEISRYHGGLSLDDIVDLSPKFWKSWLDPRLTLDGAATTLFSIQYNLVLGTLGTLGYGREDLSVLMQDLLEYKMLGQFCLTEVDHGLDAYNLETTATMVDDGYILHTPHEGAAKFMPPTIPVLGRPCIAIVWAQLIVDDVKKGVRPFIVPLNDGKRMHNGITSRQLPYRGPSMPVNHSITAFNQVKLPFAALLGEVDTAFTHHQLFLISIWRVAVGTLSLAMIGVPAMKIASTIAYRYSCRREVGIEGARQSVLSFRTQQLPVFYAVATAGVLEAFAKWATPVFSDSGMDMRVRHAIATCAKAILVSSHQSMNLLLSDRCGAQGLFDYNQIAGHHSEMRGISIAEGDILALCIRLASELLMNRYDIPATSNPISLLARHEAGLLTEFRDLCQSNGGNRSQYFANHILPQCVPIVEAIGHRMAYDAAVAAGQPDEMIALYECAMVKQDLAWYTENSVLTRAEFRQMEDQAILSAQPHIASWVDGFDVDQFITSPIVNATAWKSFVASLPTFTSTSRPISLARL